MGLKYARGPGGPNCYMSPDVQMVNGVRDIPFRGTLIAKLVSTDSTEDCQLIGVILDDQNTLIVDCLHADEEVAAFRRTCEVNAIQVTDEDLKIVAPCPPPENQMQVMGWAQDLFQKLTQSSS